MPSRVDLRTQHEGFGLAFIEAAAYGVPGVGSTGGGIPEAVLHGKTGLLVPEESPDRLAEALMILYESPETRRSMAIAGWERATKGFAPATIAEQFDRLVRARAPIATAGPNRSAVLP